MNGMETLQSRTGPGTGPEQGFLCVVFPHREIPVFITGFPGDENRFFPVRNTTQGKPCSDPVRDYNEAN